MKLNVQGQVCPLCHSQLSRKEYLRVSKLWEANQTRVKTLGEERQAVELRLQKQARDHRLELAAQRAEQDREQRAKLEEVLRRHERERQEWDKRSRRRIDLLVRQGVREKAQQLTKEIDEQKAALRKERDRMLDVQRRLDLMMEENRRLHKQLAEGITPQIDGLLEEKNLLERLRGLFPQDRFEHARRDGDIVQTVCENGVLAGTIVYECKKVRRFSVSHVDQAREARRRRGADFAVLVTNAFPAKKKNYHIERNVYVISPLNIEPVVYTLRESIARIAALSASSHEKEKAAARVLKYLTSSDYRNRINEAGGKLHERILGLQGEIADHMRNWRCRYQSYVEIHRDISVIDQELSRLIYADRGSLDSFFPMGSKALPCILELEQMETKNSPTVGKSAS